MNSSVLENLLRETVFFINEKLKKGKKNNQIAQREEEKKDSFKLNEQKIQTHWPLKKGSVDKKILAWNFYDSNENVINAFLAFTIKSFAVGIYRNNMNFSQYIGENSSKDLEKIFINPFLSAFFWDDIKKYYQSYSMNFSSNKEKRTFAVKKIVPHSSCVALCLDSTFFRLRSGSNQELSSFEFLVEDLYKANNSLIVFSRQKLIPQNNKDLKINNYSVSFKLNTDVIKSSIYEAMEPQSHLIQSSRFIEANKTGCFDRLIDLLSKGQEYIHSVEKEYAIRQSDVYTR